MKKYITPEMIISLFDGETVVTLSEPEKTSAIDEAKSAFVGMADIEHVFTVNLGE